ncbi:OmpA family protein [Bacteroidota bacterium]
MKFRNKTYSYIYKVLLILILFSFNRFTAKAQFSDSPANLFRGYGAYAGLNYNIYSADFTRLNGYPLCCPHFESGYGLGINIGGIAEFAIYKDINLQLRLGYNDISGILKKTEFETFGSDGKPINGEFEYTIDAGLSLLEFESLFVIPVFKNIELAAGMKFGFFLQKTFEQKEVIIDADDIAFIDTKSRIRNHLTGEIPDLSGMITFLTAGIKYKLPMNREGTLFISPELFCDIGLNSIQKDSSWNIISPRIGISVVYYPKPPKPVEKLYEYKEITDTVFVTKHLIAKSEFREGIKTFEYDTTYDDSRRLFYFTEFIRRTDTIFNSGSYKLEASITAVGVDDGIESPKVTMQIKEYSYFSMRPLLNYIFFDNNSLEIPKRYSLLTPKEAKQFNTEQIYDLKTLPTYYQILNIIGYRMNQFPEAGLTLVGCNSNIDEEKSNIELSKLRTKTIFDYFVNTWMIDSNRIKMRYRNLPEKPSTPDKEDGIQENSRVEIYSDTYEIISPVFINDTLRKTTPSEIRFYPIVLSEAGLAHWKIVAEQKNKELKIISGKGSIPEKVNWYIDLEKKTIPKFSEPVSFFIETIDSSGQKKRSKTQKLPLEQISIQKFNNRIGDKLIEHFSLILFDFDEISLNESNNKIKEYIKTRLKDNSEVMIAGYTDRMGDELYNEKLSQGRANTLAKSLNIPFDFVKGLGESVLLYSNDLPEGRFYCRTVEVIVETPINNDMER